MVICNSCYCSILGLSYPSSIPNALTIYKNSLFLLCDVSLYAAVICSFLVQKLLLLFREGQERQGLDVVVDEKEAELVRAEQPEGAEAGCWVMRVVVAAPEEVKSH